MSVVLGIFTFVLVLTSVFMVLIILAQRAKSDGGMGAALGGGMAEAAFGGESANVLQKITTWTAVGFFILSFGLYLGYLAVHRNAASDAGDGLPSSPGLIQAPADAGPESDFDAQPSINLNLPSSAVAAEPTEGVDASPVAPQENAGTTATEMQENSEEPATENP